jgi:hypothetical protein
MIDDYGAEDGVDMEEVNMGENEKKERKRKKIMEEWKK